MAPILNKHYCEINAKHCYTYARLFVFAFGEVAVNDVAVGVAQVHAVALAVTPERAVGTNAGLHPAAVTVLLETVLPHIPEIIGIDISLPIVCTDARASAYTAVEQH